MRFANSSGMNLMSQASPVMLGRRTPNDVTDTVNVESASAVAAAIREILEARYPGKSFELLERVFGDLERLFTGRYSGYLACETRFHDLRHTLDVTLAMARLVDGHDRVCPPREQLGPGRAMLGIVTSALHDAGYMRESHDREALHGAQYTRVHVSRSATFLSRYLPRIGLAERVPLAENLVHFTGYEVAIDSIPVEHPLDRRLGYMLGTADLLAQMSDRLYLEKCRDYLYEEFVLGGIASEARDDGSGRLRYESPEDLIRQTPEFHRTVAGHRMGGVFDGVQRYAAAHFDGHDLYGEQIDQHLRFLGDAITSDRLDRLRRRSRTLTGESGAAGGNEAESQTEVPRKGRSKREGSQAPGGMR